MKEKYLHYLWLNKLIPFHRINISNCRTFQIIESGEYNEYGSGPDFLNAKIRMDEMIWIGDVEIHIRASDWFRHGHHVDHAYNQVILHVVLFNDAMITQNGFMIPFMELKEIVDHTHYHSYISHYHYNKKILCGTLLKSIPLIAIQNALDKSLSQRFLRKLNDLNGFDDSKQVLYTLLARSFGTTVNKLPFEQLTVRMPIDKLKFLDPEERVEMIKYVSGLFEFDKELSFLKINHIMQTRLCIPNGIISKSSWVFGGVRPSNNPRIRMIQFAAFIAVFDFDMNICNLTSDGLINNISLFFEKASQLIPVKFSKSFKDLILINAIVPFMVWQSAQEQDPMLRQTADEILQQISPEKNNILAKWSKFGIHAKSSFQTQALMELYKSFCVKKRCLTCDIGLFLLQS